MFLPMIIYVPSLAFSQASGADIHLISIIICIICAFYTILGGIRAVVYTDTFQTVVMFIGQVIILIVGCVKAGGFNSVFKQNTEGGRLDPLSFSPSMYERFTFFSVVIGGFFYWTSFNAVNQTMVQRYLSLPDDKQAKIAVLVFTIGVVIFVSMCCFAGLLLYNHYRECDPLTANLIAVSDQMLPLYVVETTAFMHGLPGLFIAGVFAASLSSLSVVFNSSAVVLLEDFLRGLCNIQLSERAATIISKVIVVILAVCACALVFVIEHLGGIFEVATCFSSISAGTMFGVFSLGMLVPWSNTNGVITGAVFGFLLSTVISYGNRYVVATGQVVAHQLPISVEGCNRTYGRFINATPKVYPDESGVFPLFKLAYLWITPIGIVTVIVTGTVASFAIGKTDLKTLDPDLISPVVQWLLPEEAKIWSGTSVKKVEHKRLLDASARNETPTTSASQQ